MSNDRMTTEKLDSKGAIEHSVADILELRTETTIENWYERVEKEPILTRLPIEPRSALRSLAGDVP